MSSTVAALNISYSPFVWWHWYMTINVKSCTMDNHHGGVQLNKCWHAYKCIPQFSTFTVIRSNHNFITTVM